MKQIAQVFKFVDFLFSVAISLNKTINAKSKAKYQRVLKETSYVCFLFLRLLIKRWKRSN